LLRFDTQELNRGALHGALEATTEIMKEQPYATLTPGPHRANQSINPPFCKANRRRRKSDTVSTLGHTALTHRAQ
jgi:hypothetical protein